MGFRAAGGGGSGPAERWLDHQDNGRRPSKGEIVCSDFHFSRRNLYYYYSVLYLTNLIIGLLLSLMHFLCSHPHGKYLI